MDKCNKRVFVSCRLYEAHRRVQRVNQGLEDKLLKLVDACETEKNALTKDVATLSHKLAEANYAIKKLTDDNVSISFNVTHNLNLKFSSSILVYIIYHGN